MSNFKILEAIKSINPASETVIRGSDIDTCEIEWHNGTAEISKADIKTKIAELQTDYDAKEYQRDREVAYPAMADQLDMQYWDQVNGTTTWKDAIAKVKTDNPKE